jgi:hypothetical protein
VPIADMVIGTGMSPLAVSDVYCCLHWSRWTAKPPASYGLRSHLER